MYVYVSCMCICLNLKDWNGWQWLSVVAGTTQLRADSHWWQTVRRKNISYKWLFCQKQKLTYMFTFLPHRRRTTLNISTTGHRNSEGNKWRSQESQRLLVPYSWSTLNNIQSSGGGIKYILNKWIQKIRMTSDDSWWIQCSTKQYRLLIQLHGKFKLKI